MASFSLVAKGLAAVVPVVVVLTLIVLVAGMAGAPRMALAAPGSVNSAPAGEAERRELLFHGPTPTVDPGFAYYQGRSAESIAEELALRGYKTVHLVITSEKNVNGALIDALHQQGIAVWGMVWAGGTYSTTGFPPEWPDWRQQLITPAAPSGFIYLSLFHPGYRAWKKEALAELVRNYPIDGIELVEAFFPNWDGLRSGVYGDIGPYAVAAFRQRFGEDPPNFTDRRDPRYYTKVPELYRRWVQFRVDAVTDFLDELVNGKGGIREARPGIPVATWTLATDWPGALEKSRVDLGEDTAAIVTKVRPDIHFFQTNWPDWIKPNLLPDYVRRYAPFIQELRRVAPNLPVGVQADIGSLQQVRRGWDWIAAFEKAAWETGFSTYTLYEYHIGLYMYTEKPRIVRVRRGGPGWVILSFNKRVDATSAQDTDHYQVVTSAGTPAEVDQVFVDGNRVMLHLNIPDGLDAGPLTIRVEGIQDAAELRLLKNYPALTMEPQEISL
ncbi:MAG TPA: N-acyl-D-glucosamine 2-epimerase [Firmicutes bacterium]|nr:N-acyl-D-glucosamine 2-epimerase [Bacillota bacterium]